MNINAPYSQYVSFHLRVIAGVAKRSLCIFVIFAFLFNSFSPLPLAQSQELKLPVPGVMVHLSPPLEPPVLKGIKVHPDDPFRFDFILDVGDGSKPSLNGRVMNPPLQEESIKLIKYFLVSLTIPEKDLWVNLSPYEKDRIIPSSFGLTEMGRDLLAEDYMLKQITASLIYPEDKIGRKFWARIYAEAQKKYGTTNIPVNTFNKVWIVPEKAVVYENSKTSTAYVVESKLKVMLEEDYLALEKNQTPTRGHVPLTEGKGYVSPSRLPTNEGLQSKAPQGNHFSTNENINALGSQIVRKIVIPELTKEVNTAKNFSKLRQVYNSLILATWYKKKIKDSILAQVYADKKKIAGVGYGNVTDVEGIYHRYLQAFKKGVYNYIKEDTDPVTQEVIPRKYFSGGVSFGENHVWDTAMTVVDEKAKSPFAKMIRNRLITAVAAAASLFSVIGCRMDGIPRVPVEQPGFSHLRSELKLPPGVKFFSEDIFIEGIDDPRKFPLSIEESKPYPLILKGAIARAARMVADKIKMLPSSDKDGLFLRTVEGRLKQLNPEGITIFDSLSYLNYAGKAFDVYSGNGQAVYIDQTDLHSPSLPLAVIQQVIFNINLKTGTDAHQTAREAVQRTAEIFGPRIKVQPLVGFSGIPNSIFVDLNSFALPSNQAIQDAIRLKAMELLAQEEDPQTINFLSNLLPDINERLGWTRDDDVREIEKTFDDMSQVDPALPPDKQKEELKARKNLRQAGINEIASLSPDKAHFDDTIRKIKKWGMVRTLTLSMGIRQSLYNDREQFEKGVSDDRHMVMVFTNTYDWNGAMFESSYAGLTYQSITQGDQVLWVEQRSFDDVLDSINRFTRDKKGTVILHTHGDVDQLVGWIYFPEVHYVFGTAKEISPEYTAKIEGTKGHADRVIILGCSTGGQRKAGPNIAKFLADAWGVPVDAPGSIPTGVELPTKDHPTIYYNEMTGERVLVPTNTAYPALTGSTVQETEIQKEILERAVQLTVDHYKEFGPVVQEEVKKYLQIIISSDKKEPNQEAQDALQKVFESLPEYKNNPEKAKEAVDAVMIFFEMDMSLAQKEKAKAVSTQPSTLPATQPTTQPTSQPMSQQEPADHAMMTLREISDGYIAKLERRLSSAKSAEDRERIQKALDEGRRKVTQLHDLVQRDGIVNLPSILRKMGEGARSPNDLKPQQKRAIEILLKDSKRKNSVIPNFNPDEVVFIKHNSFLANLFGFNASGGFLGRNTQGWQLVMINEDLTDERSNVEALVHEFIHERFHQGEIIAKRNGNGFTHSIFNEAMTENLTQNSLGSLAKRFPELFRKLSPASKIFAAVGLVPTGTYRDERELLKALMRVEGTENVMMEFLTTGNMGPLRALYPAFWDKFVHIIEETDPLYAPKGFIPMLKFAALKPSSLKRLKLCAQAIALSMSLLINEEYGKVDILDLLDQKFLLGTSSIPTEQDLRKLMIDVAGEDFKARGLTVSVSFDDEMYDNELQRLWPDEAMVTTKGAHNTYNLLVTQNGVVLNKLAREIGADLLPRKTTVIDHQQFEDYDFRQAIMNLRRSHDPRVLQDGFNRTTYVHLGGGRFFILDERHQDPFVKDQPELVFIDPDFGGAQVEYIGHAGRTRNQVYATDFARAMHELSELRFWKELERRLSTVEKAGIVPSDPDRPHNIGEWTRSNLDSANSFDAEFHKSGEDVERYVIRSTPQINGEGFIRQGLWALISSSIDQKVAGTDFDQINIKSELSQYSAEKYSFDQMIQLFDDSKANGKIRLDIPPDGFPTTEDYMKLRNRGIVLTDQTRAGLRMFNITQAQTKPAYEVSIFQRKSTGEWFAAKGNEKDTLAHLESLLGLVGDISFSYHNHPMLQNSEYPYSYPPSANDFISLFQKSKDRIGVVGALLYVYVYSSPLTPPSGKTLLQLLGEMQEAYQNVWEKASQKAQEAAATSKPMNFLDYETHAFEEWKKYLNGLGFSLERYPWPYFADHRADFYKRLRGEAPPSQSGEDVVIANRGGIDLTPARMNVEVRKEIASPSARNDGGAKIASARNDEAEGIKFHLDPAQLAQLQNTRGFVPVIINVQPLKSLQEFLGISQDSI